MSTTQFDTNYVAFTVVNGYLNDVTITTEKVGQTASSPDPADEASDVSREVVLSWRPGESAVAHDVYFGTSFDDVNAASVDSPLDVLVSPSQDANTYDPVGRLEFSQSYYWRIDEVNTASENPIVRGEVWSFTTEPLTYPVEDITATASCSNDVDSGPEKTIDGSGLTIDGQHLIEQTDMWVGTPDEGEPVWIQYDFDRAYKLHDMHIWNANMAWESLLNFGLETITVEYTADGDAWTTFGDLQLEQAPGEVTYAGQTIDLGGIVAKSVRITAISTFGGDSYGLSEIRFNYIPTYASHPVPADGATGVALNPVLTWRAGREAASHQVFFGASEQVVAGGTALVDTVTDTSYTVAALNLDTTYYWQIDEVNETEDVTIWPGSVWSFTTKSYLVVDDFESYTEDMDAGQAIFQTWVDGYEIGDNGSLVGHDDPPYVERATVHGGKQAMPYRYDNRDTATSSRAERTFDTPQDWTQSGAATLTLYFYGSPDNDANEPMWVRLTDSSGATGQITYGSAEGESIDNQALAAWSQWSIPLSSFGVNPATIESMVIGFGNTGPRSAGLMLFDDIRLQP